MIGLFSWGQLSIMAALLVVAALIGFFGGQSLSEQKFTASAPKTELYNTPTELDFLQLFRASSINFEGQVTKVANPTAEVLNKDSRKYTFQVNNEVVILKRTNRNSPTTAVPSKPETLPLNKLGTITLKDINGQYKIVGFEYIESSPAARSR